VAEKPLALLVALRAVKRLVKRREVWRKGVFANYWKPNDFFRRRWDRNGKKNKRGKNARSILPYAHF